MVLTGENANLLEVLYQKYRRDPRSIAPSWARYFQGLDQNLDQDMEQRHNGLPLLNMAEQSLSETVDRKQLGLQMLIESYRRFGNLAANIDPLNMRQLNRELLQLELYDLSEKDLGRSFQTEIEALSNARLSDIIAWYEKTYCNTIGVEYAYIRNTAERNWLQGVMEASANSWPLDKSYRLRLYEKLFQSEYFEKFLAQKYVGRKRFSIEGSESFIPLLDAVIEEGGRLGVECMVIGMAHRGRLNVLVNILNKPAPILFAEFDENSNPDTPDYSDVKYHLGYSYDRMTRCGREVHLSLAFNPSHLEAVDPVIVGSVRARQTRRGDSERHRIVPVMVHGDAAFMGQGVVAETLNLANLEGYRVGGTVHILINNQIGFTTLPSETRSTEYATDLAKAFQLPIFHVNGDDPEAVFRTVRLAMEYRQHFHKDVMIDLICYRRLGHNETDEPAFTQPIMYDIIRNHPSVVKKYRQKLLEEGDTDEKEIAFIENGARSGLQEAFHQARSNNIHMSIDTMKGEWSSFLSEPLDSEPQTRLLKGQLKQLVHVLTEIPDDFNLHPKLQRLLESRKKMYANEIPIDWGFAEALALGSILENSYNIRLSGQDVCRGTFSHRHGVLVDVKNGHKYIPLQHISEKQGRFEIINSPLSEFSALGFEYGYSLTAPHTLTLWEAQFGDFVNGAQIIIDQFISSTEVKWHRMSGLVLLLPHGYEGQGPEHSSARLERFLQLCANKNIQVCNCSTPAQYFHLLRRQILRKFRKPLIILTPKSLLRLPEAGSSMEEISKSVFQEVLTDPHSIKGQKIRRLLLCSGKVYYDLDAYRKQHSIKDIVLLRLEQLYPFPEELLGKVISRYAAPQLVWVQEEPVNQGAWSYLEARLLKLLDKKIELRSVTRPTSPTPGDGLFKQHQREQDELVKRALL